MIIFLSTINHDKMFQLPQPHKSTRIEGFSSYSVCGRACAIHACREELDWRRERVIDFTISTHQGWPLRWFRYYFISFPPRISALIKNKHNSLFQEIKLYIIFPFWQTKGNHWPTKVMTIQSINKYATELVLPIYRVPTKALTSTSWEI